MLFLNSIKALLAVTFTITLIRQAFSTNYCSKKLCPRKNHIRCGNDGSFGKNCPKDAVEISINEELRKLIVDKHNEVRKGISQGNYKGLKNANRMIEMVK